MTSQPPSANVQAVATVGDKLPSTARPATRLMHLITGTGVGGAEMMLYKLLSHMDRDRFSNVVVSMLPLGPTADLIQALGVRVQTLGMKMGVPDPRSISRLARALRTWRPHILQTWMYHADLLGGVVGKMLFRLPVVWNIRHSDPSRGDNDWMTLKVAALCGQLSKWVPDRIICCAHSSRALHVGIGYAEAKMRVIPNGFDLEAYRPSPGAAAACFDRFGIPVGPDLISLIARYHPQKDHPNFISAAKICSERFPEALFALCGDDITPANEALISLIRQAGIQQRTFLLGRRTPAEIALIMSRSSLVTSSSSAEAFPNVVGEAMACGAICVATDVGDSARIIGDTGLVVPAQSPEQLASAWTTVLDMDKNTRADLGRAARRRVESTFGLSSIVSQYESLYLELITPRVPQALPIETRA